MSTIKAVFLFLLSACFLNAVVHASASHSSPVDGERDAYACICSEHVLCLRDAVGVWVWRLPNSCAELLMDSVGSVPF
jgi:hypothetical protein